MTVGRIEITSGELTVTARLRGEIDLSNALAVTEEILEACAEQKRLIVDLGGVTYLDSSGIRMIFELARRCKVGGQLIVLVVPKASPVRRLLEITNVEDQALIVDDHEDLDEVSQTS